VSVCFMYACANMYIYVFMYICICFVFDMCYVESIVRDIFS
jgi:hypothetical protein